MKTRTLRIRNHHDACLLACAVREYGKKRNDEAHYAMLAALQRGDQKEAERCTKIRDEVYEASRHYEHALQKLIDKFEAERDDDMSYPEGSGGGGVSHAGMLDGN